ncbi:DUF3237 domain-containing protein [Subtercola sp. YIM 133946]|uniref:DUF3237 domain-containing protein n=1 Tax=Subtercola sp. YIM 133946 TaxID=3118909 RepID=UPI002F958D12
MSDFGVAPTLSFLARIEVSVAAPIDLGAGDGPHRRIVPILGGTVSGPDLNGVVLPGGADFQVLRSSTLTELEARYAVETSDGDRIYVENFGLRSGSQEDITRIVAGQTVDPSKIYFRSSPRLSSPAPRWAWLASRILVARGERRPESVRLYIFVVD